MFVASLAGSVVGTSSQTVSFQFRPSQEQGLILLVTTPTNRPVFGFGLYEGEVTTPTYTQQ